MYISWLYLYNLPEVQIAIKPSLGYLYLACILSEVQLAIAHPLEQKKVRRSDTVPTKRNWTPREILDPIMNSSQRLFPRKWSRRRNCRYCYVVIKTSKWNRANGNRKPRKYAVSKQQWNPVRNRPMTPLEMCHSSNHKPRLSTNN